MSSRPRPHHVMREIINRAYKESKRQLETWRKLWYMALVFCIVSWMLVVTVAAVRWEFLTRSSFAGTIPGNILLWTPVIEHVVALIVFWWLMVGFRTPGSTVSIPLASRRKMSHMLVAAVGVGLLSYGVNYLLTSLGGPANNPFWRALINCRVCVWAYVLDVIIVAPVVEEIIFRGLMFRAIEEGVGKWWAVVFSSLGFLLFHLFQSQWRVTSLTTYLFFAVCVGVLRAWSGSVWPGWVAHVINNVIVGITLLRL